MTNLRRFVGRSWGPRKTSQRLMHTLPVDLKASENEKSLSFFVRRQYGLQKASILCACVRVSVTMNLQQMGPVSNFRPR